MLQCEGTVSLAMPCFCLNPYVQIISPTLIEVKKNLNGQSKPYHTESFCTDNKSNSNVKSWLRSAETRSRI